MDVITRLAYWLYCRCRDYQEGLALMRELKIERGDAAFFEVAVPGKIHQSLMWRKLADYARVHNIGPALPVLSDAEANPKESKPANSKFGSSPLVGEPRLVSGAEPGQTTTSSRPRIDKNPVIRYEELPATLQVLFDENGKLANEMKSLHAELKQLKGVTDAKGKRAGIARELVLRQKQNRANWNEIDTWWESNNVEEDTAVAAARQAGICPAIWSGHS